MGYTYTLNGVTHTMSDAEAEAIERSGTPHRVQDYATIMGRTSYGDYPHGGLALGVRLMADRPDAIEAGLRPTLVDELGAPPDFSLPGLKVGAIHLRLKANFRACLKGVAMGDTFNSKIFAMMIEHPRACPDCVAAYYAANAKKVEAVAEAIVRTNPVKRDKRSEGYVKPMNWTPEERERLNRYRKCRR